MVDAWKDCFSCKSRYNASLEHCPKCGAVNSVHLDKGAEVGGKKNRPLSLRRLVIIGIIVPVAVLLAFVLMNQATRHPNPYVNEIFGFTIRYPDGWALHENYQQGDVNNIVIFYNNKANFIIHAREWNSESYADIISSVKDRMIEQYGRDHNLIVNEEGDVKIANVNSHYIVYTFIDGGSIWSQKAYYFVNDNKVFTIVFSAKLDDYGAEVPQFDKALSTLTFV